MHIKIRLATFEDIASLDALMKRSMQVLAKGHYTDSQIEACLQFVCVPDRQIIEDQTFFVALSSDSNIIGCGGWSFRDKHCSGQTETSSKCRKIDPATEEARIRAMFVDPCYSGRGIGSRILDHSEKVAKEKGFSQGTLSATLSGFAFYKARGWVGEAEEPLTLPNGININIVVMKKSFC
jgi:GNAT superfamily N-acetyltransferase